MNPHTQCHQWLEQQKQFNRTVFAIVDPLSEHAPQRVFFQSGGTDGAPLLSLQQLTNPEDGPWLLPTNEAFLQWWAQEEHAQSGILLAADKSDIEPIRAHFSSLFQAILLGEIVFFPFYRPDYLGKILARLEIEECNALLAGYGLLLWSERQWQSCPSLISFTPEVRELPWWKFEEHHLDNTPNVPLLASNIESWLWQHQSALMQNRIATNLGDFCTLFKKRFLELESETWTLTAKASSAAVCAVLDQTTINLAVWEAITEVQDDELLFALKHIFPQLQELLQGHA